MCTSLRCDAKPGCDRRTVRWSGRPTACGAGPVDLTTDALRPRINELASIVKARRILDSVPGPSACPGRATRRTDADGAGTERRPAPVPGHPDQDRARGGAAVRRTRDRRGPLRDIVTAAGQRNASAIQYHFGPRPDLVTAVFQYRMGQINERRLEHRRRCTRKGRAADPRTLVEALVRPLVEAVGEPGCHYALAQLSASRTTGSDSWQIVPASARCARDCSGH
ncbi:hypothetical protein HBB16_21450 [Pseudonocardia sp. MCCB 268]|nr:hypothetical protein [Pseudonocardia cytotoxica]